MGGGTAGGEGVQDFGGVGQGREGRGVGGGAGGSLFHATVSLFGFEFAERPIETALMHRVIAVQEGDGFGAFGITDVIEAAGFELAKGGG